MWIAFIIATIFFWYFTLPLLLIWLVWKKTKLNRQKKLISIGVIIVFFVVVVGIKNYITRAPKITIIEPENNFSIQAESITIKGKVSPKKSQIIFNGITIATIDGDFEYLLELFNEQNNFVFSAKNGEKESKATITVNRIFTEEELVEREKQQEQQKKEMEIQKAEAEKKKQAILEAQKKAEEERKAKELAEQKAWEQSKAGKICKAHPEWGKNDCERLANNKIWIGMSLDMLKYRRGVPNSSNPSNYGYGTSWQWCWHDYTPSCFYGDDDGIVDSFN
ncbi:cell envelope integrity protein TolA [Patescibacteria group bacterium]